MVVYTGWSYRGRPFSEQMFNNSAIKRTFGRSGLTYKQYLLEYAKNYKKKRK